MLEVVTFGDALEMAGQENRHVLLGNGFSIAQAGGQFSYSSLLERSGLEAANPIRNVFRVLETVDFEAVMHALEHAAQIEAAYGDDQRSKLFQGDAVAVREALIHAVREVHPAIQFDIPEEQRETCSVFLNSFQSIFTLNYDLLLYWVILSGGPVKHSDGFGLGKAVAGFRTFRPDANCTTYYLHGALHLFLDSQLETQKRVITNSTIIDGIESTIRGRGQLPLFVAEGLATQKIARINSVPYLRHCHEALNELEGSLFVFGHSAADNDSHIYDAIFRSQIGKLFFCVHRPEEDWLDLRERLAPYAERRGDVEIIYVDAATANVWGEDG